MKSRTSSLLWLATACLAAVILMQVFLIRSELLQATADLASVQSDIEHTQAGLASITRRTDRLEELLRARQGDQTTPPELSPEERIIEALRSKLAEIARRHAGEIRPAPLTTIHSNNYAAELLGDPAYAQIYRAWYRGILEKDWNEFLVSGVAPPETMARLADLLMERQLGVMDLIAVTGASRYGPGNLPTKAQRDENSRASQTLFDRFATEIRTLLGDEGFRRFQQYEGTMNFRRDLTKFADRLSYTDSPLIPAQRAQLLDLIASPGLAPVRESLLRRNIPEGDAFEAKVQAVLTPSQRESLQDLRGESARAAAIK